MSNANEPAFAGITYTEIPSGGARMHQIGGLTKREHAAIALRVPMSGDNEIDAMIRAANRKDIAAMAMQGLLSRSEGWGAADLTSASTHYADALLAELERTA